MIVSDYSVQYFNDPERMFRVPPGTRGGRVRIEALPRVMFSSDSDFGYSGFYEHTIETPFTIQNPAASLAFPNSTLQYGETFVSSARVDSIEFYATDILELKVGEVSAKQFSFARNNVSGEVELSMVAEPGMNGTFDFTLSGLCFEGNEKSLKDGLNCTKHFAIAKTFETLGSPPSNLGLYGLLVIPILGLLLLLRFRSKRQNKARETNPNAANTNQNRTVARNGDSHANFGTSSQNRAMPSPLSSSAKRQAKSAAEGSTTGTRSIHIATDIARAEEDTSIPMAVLVSEAPIPYAYESSLST